MTSIRKLWRRCDRRIACNESRRTSRLIRFHNNDALQRNRLRPTCSFVALDYESTSIHIDVSSYLTYKYASNLINGKVLSTDSAQLKRARHHESSLDFPMSIEYDHRIETLIFGNRMCGTLEIVSSPANKNTFIELSDTASREIELHEGRGTVIFTRRTSPYSFFREDNANDRHKALIRVVTPPEALRRVCSHTRLATVKINDYEADEFSVNASRGGAIFLKNVRSQTLRYEAVSGASTIHAESIEVENLIGVAYASCHVLLSGTAVNHRLAATHRAIIDARQLESQHAIVNSFHSSRVHFGSVNSIKAHARNKARLFLSQIGTFNADRISEGREGFCKSTNRPNLNAIVCTVVIVATVYKNPSPEVGYAVNRLQPS